MSIESSSAASTSAALPSSAVPGVTRFHWPELAGPIAVVVAVTYVVSSLGASSSFLVQGTLVTLVMVLALQV